MAVNDRQVIRSLYTVSGSAMRECIISHLEKTSSGSAMARVTTSRWVGEAMRALGFRRGEKDD